jgi:hypothetical protein
VQGFLYNGKHVKVTGGARVIFSKPFTSDTSASEKDKKPDAPAKHLCHEQHSVSRFCVAFPTTPFLTNAQARPTTAINMCIYSHFQYLCLHEKLKIIRACSKAFKDSQGVLTCPDTPNLQTNDDIHRTFGHRTYGVGVCSSIHCAWSHGILPCGDYGNNKKFGKSTSFEDDTEIKDSPTVREERVGRWFRLLNADQQLDHFKTEYPLPEHELSAAGRALLHFPSGAGVIDSVDTLRWQELNPLYLTPAMLQRCVFYRLLPASVVDGRKSKTITPHKPVLGPFKPQEAHECPKKRGICKVCGETLATES